jgi:hypothetical protein
MSEENTIWFKPEKFVISFHGDSGKDLGKLTENDDGELVFEGNADESAKVFFDAVVRVNNKKMNDVAVLLRLAKCPNAHCVDGMVQEGFPDECVFECQWCAERKDLLAGGK